MGCGTSTANGPTQLDQTLVPVPNPNGKKTVVIVGASFGGLTIGDGLWNDHNVVFIDKKDHFEFTPASVKFVTEAKWGNRMTSPLSELVTGFGNKFKHIQGTLLNVASTINAVEIQLADGKKVGIGYDILVLATGFLYEAPIK